MTTPQLVLIVDDEPNVALVLAESLEKLSGSYIVHTANDGTAALAQLRLHTYALMITDYKMPGMNGLDLAREARKIHPALQIVLMTAHGTDGLRDAAGKLHFNGYIDKPFSIEQIRAIVEKAVKKTQVSTAKETAAVGLPPSVYEQLLKLRNDTGVRCVILLSASGYPIETAGQTNGLDVSSIAALVAANFTAASELARLLGRKSVFKSSYHEGQEGTDDNIYAYDIDGEFLLAVVFGIESKPGVVWFYTKQTAANLVDLVKPSLLTASQAPSAATALENSLLSIEDAIAAGLVPAEFAQAASQTYAEQLDSFWN